MGKRELAKLEREQAARHAARAAVYKALWEGNALYRKRCEYKDNLNRALSHALAYTPATVELLKARFSRACKRCQRMEDDALRAAGFTP